METINREDIRRAMGLNPGQTITTVNMSGSDIIFSISSVEMLPIASEDYVNIINRNMAARKEIYFLYREGTNIRRFLPQRWNNASVIEGLDLDVDDIRRFDLNYIYSMTANAILPANAF